MTAAGKQNASSADKSRAPTAIIVLDENTDARSTARRDSIRTKNCQLPERKKAANW